ncbi:hypothetical protein BDZ45DRAFT_670749 [Acephala macrosclerotiorum]|nr:hypothetical protein BDZ45DRAFT_670749 [Acephala macrosclerotiorum]
MSAFPPHRLGPSIPVTQEIALKFLTTYLSATTTSPHLLPNAKLDPSGPTAGSSSSSVTIYNLQRVEAGLRGEWLAPTLDLEENNVTVAEGMDDGVNQGQGAMDGGEGWMDLDEYQREQSIEGGEIGDEGHVVGQAGEESDLEVDRAVVDEREREDEDAHADAHAVKVPKKTTKTNGVTKSPIKKPTDKEARKTAKREKMLQERREKNEKMRLAAAER